MKTVVSAIFVVMALFLGSLNAQDTVDQRKIDFLLSSMERLKGAKFIRNGSEYDGIEAAKHLRMKRIAAGGKVKTADDFIRICASKSSISGISYTIRLSDGKIMKSEEYFRKKLKEYHSTVQ
jgi:hypothetical protein